MSDLHRGKHRVRRQHAGHRVNALFATKVEADAFEAAWVAAVTLGHEPPAPHSTIVPSPAPPPVAAPKGITVEAASKEFVKGIRAGTIKTKSGRRYKPASVREYESRLRNHVLPEIGRLMVPLVRRSDIRVMLEDLEEEKGAAVAGNALSAAQVLFRRCLDLDVIESNPTAGIRAPAVDRRKPRVLTTEEATAVRRAAAAAGGMIHPLVELALASGLRKGELLALEWGAEGVDLKAKTVHVNYTLDAIEGRVTPKSGESRIVPLGDRIVLLLRRYRLASTESQDGDLVFPRYRPTEDWCAVRDAAGLPEVWMHDLRRTAGSYWRAQGFQSHEVATLLGHRDGGILAEKVYVRALPERMADAGNRLEAMLGDA